MEQLYDDTFLARWLGGALSEEELRMFEADPEYKKYLEIAETSNLAKFPEFDVDANFETVLQKIELDNSNKTIPLKRKRKALHWTYAIAASLLLFLGYTQFFKATTYTTQLAEQTEFTLPDHSKVHLNAGSKIKYKSFNWDKNRTLTLNGEAYFEVEKGSVFTVNTTSGDVTVLGTRFTVNSRENYYNVVCYEGKVKVEYKGSEAIILTKGESFTLQDDIEKNKSENKDKIPSWLNNESSFNAVSIIEVAKELERQYNIVIEGKTNLKPIYFSGRFMHDDLTVALRVVFETLDIPYKLKANGDVIIIKH